MLLVEPRQVIYPEFEEEDQTGRLTIHGNILYTVLMVHI